MQLYTIFETETGLYTDGSYLHEIGRAAGGWILRDHKGKWVFGGRKRYPLKSIYGSFYSEMIAVGSSMLEAKDQKKTKIVGLL